MPAPCIHCHAYHADPSTGGVNANHRDWTATDEDVAAAQADPDRWVRVWNEASAAYWQVAIAHQDVVRFRNALPVGSRERKAMNAVVNASGAALCASIRTMWRLPHPTQTLNIRVGCL